MVADVRRNMLFSKARDLFYSAVPTLISGVFLALFIILGFRVQNPVGWLVIYSVPFVGPVLGLEWATRASWSNSFILGIWLYTILTLILMSSVLTRRSMVARVISGVGCFLWYFAGWIFLLGSE